MAAIRLIRPLLMFALTLCVGVGCTRAYIQSEGIYKFTAQEVLRDECAMLSAPETLWGGELFISGEVVRMRYELMDMLLVGAFLEGGSDDDDAFMLDGSLTNASVTANGHQCFVDQVTVNMRGTTQNAMEFSGVLRVRYEPRLQQAQCACELWVRYQAVRQKELPTESPR